MKLLLIILLKTSILSLLCSANIDEDYYNRIQSAIDLLKKEGIPINDSTSDDQIVKMGSNFPCELFKVPSRKDITVNTLTPYDIKVVGAIGDSITAAFGAKATSLLNLFTESRGVSWSIGGDETLDTVTTLPNIIKKYNPDLKGFSVGKGNQDSPNAKFDVAVSAAVASGMLAQAENLVEKMRNDDVCELAATIIEVDFENDWKVVTLWIGGNNLCSSCRLIFNLKEQSKPENYVDDIKQALDYLHKELPKTFVNLVQIIDVTKLNKLNCLRCRLLHSVLCPCARRVKQKTITLSQKYQAGLEELVESGRYDDKDDFTVIIQPFFEGIEVPLTKKGKADKSYFAPDCFHFSEKAHKEGAIALWDNMIQPVGQKNTGWTIGKGISCPTEESPYFYTNKNSNPTLFSTSQLANNIQLDDNKSGSNHYGGIMIGSVIGSISCSVVVVIIVAILIVRFKSNRDPEKAVLLNKN